MHPELIIRDELANDIDVITNITIAAFKNLDVSEQTEHFIVNALRRSGALTISLVAELNNKAVGHIAFSPVTFSDGTENWFGLGPVSVLPDYQNRGIGSELIKHGLDKLRQLEACGCCLIGHPDYYGRFGFENIEGLEYTNAPKQAIFALLFKGKLPQGQIQFHRSFNAVS